jgi:hypothetical protein
MDFPALAMTRLRNKLFYFFQPHIRFIYDEEKRNKRHRENIRNVLTGSGR